LDLEQWTTRPKRCTRFFQLFWFWPYDRNHSIIRTLTLKHKKHLLFLFKQKYLYNFFINLCFDIFCKRKKSFIHILQTSRNKKQQHLSFISYNISFRTCFHKFNSIFHRKLEKHFSFSFSSKNLTYMFTLVSGNLSFILHVTFISYQHSFDFRWCMLKNFRIIFHQIPIFEFILLRYFESNFWYYQNFFHLWCHIPTWFPKLNNRMIVSKKCFQLPLLHDNKRWLLFWIVPKDGYEIYDITNRVLLDRPYP